MRARRTTLLLLVVAIVGCFPEDEPALAPLCPTAVVQTNAGGGPPVFDWPSGCGASALQVTAASNRADVKWSISTPDEQPTVPHPVTYGQLPVGLNQGTAPATLASGAEYRMNLLLVVDGIASTIASVRFTQP